MTRIVMRQVSPRKGCRVVIPVEHAHQHHQQQQQGTYTKTLKKRMKSLEQQLELMSREREGQLDQLEEMQRMAEAAQMEAVQLKACLCIKVAECEKLTREARKEAIRLVKSEWRSKLDDLASGNVTLFSEIQLRDKQIAELQKGLRAAQNGDDRDGKFLDKITLLTAEVLRHEKLLGEKDAALYSYEARLENAEKALHTALETQCKMESHVNETLKVKEEQQRELVMMAAQNQRLESSLGDSVSPRYAAGNASGQAHEASLTNSKKQRKARLQSYQTEECRHLMDFFLARLTASEEQRKRSERLAAWMAFALWRKTSQLSAKGQQLLSSETTVSILGQALERGKASVQWTQEVIAETHERRLAAETALEAQRRQHERQQKVWDKRESEMSATITTLKEQLHTTREKLAEEQLLYQKHPPQSMLQPSLTMEESNRSTVMTMETHIPPTRRNTARESSLHDDNAAASDAGKVGTADDRMTSEAAMSDAMESLAVVQDASEAGAIIATLLSLHRQAVGEWRNRAIASERRAGKADRIAFSLSVLIHQGVLPHLHALIVMCTDGVAEKTKSVLADYSRLVRSTTSGDAAAADARTEAAGEVDVSESQLVLMWKSWCKWRVFVEAARVAALKMRATRTISSMAKSHEQLKVIAERAMARVKELEKLREEPTGGLSG
ncbi:hypothetical protein DQ04_00471130 [Trypanosoma grayi]|uniref:hypothetical protein n=1 Tax=Trypanosoma grayi TaxID=71804 RepID=UPI0004F413E5|nr:hypothetical protein DQ04_00471130 [Trypanosoma grayi]KEG14439.1 hypothetical protein DQ04_00471130 [Trypanosoma grayi]